MTGERMIVGEGVIQPRDSFEYRLLVVGLGRILAVALQRNVDNTAARRPPHFEVVAPGEDDLEFAQELRQDTSVVLNQGLERQPGARYEFARLALEA